jgi:hypothetical protein
MNRNNKDNYGLLKKVIVGFFTLVVLIAIVWYWESHSVITKIFSFLALLTGLVYLISENQKNLGILFIIFYICAVVSQYI